MHEPKLQTASAIRAEWIISWVLQQVGSAHRHNIMKNALKKKGGGKESGAKLKLWNFIKDMHVSLFLSPVRLTDPFVALIRSLY